MQIITNEASKIIYDGDYSFYNDNGNYYLLGYHGTETEITLPNKINDSNYAIYKYAFYKCSRLESVTIGNSVTSIGAGAFRYCSSLTSITIPDSVTSIGMYAFDNCDSLQYNVSDNAKYLGNNSNPYVCLMEIIDTSITMFNIPTTTKFIYQYAFYYCSSLKSVTIPNSVTSVGNYAFEYCDSLTSITIPDSVTIIGQYAFRYCYSLESVTIGNGVTSIGRDAFAYCYSLESLTYNGTKAQWDAISKDSDWNRYTGNYTIHCTDGDI